jgi:phosphohistidine phosphatase
MIWLLRHGEAAEGHPDDDRPLTELGEKQARAAGIALAKIGVRIELCLSSPKLRAVETARLACEALGVEVTLEERLKGEPFDPEDLVGDVKEALLVGHDPAFSAAVHASTGAQVRMEKGGLAGLEPGELNVLLRTTETFALAG